MSVHTATGTRGDATLATDAALVFELSAGIVTAITVHQKYPGEWDEFFR